MAKRNSYWPSRPQPKPIKMNPRKFNQAIHMIGNSDTHLSACGATCNSGTLLSINDIDAVTCFLCKPMKKNHGRS